MRSGTLKSVKQLLQEHGVMKIIRGYAENAPKGVKLPRLANLFIYYITSCCEVIIFSFFFFYQECVEGIKVALANV